MTPTRTLTIPQVAELAQLHRKTIERHIRDGRLGSIYLGSQVRVPVEEYEAWLERSRRAPRQVPRPEPAQGSTPGAGGRLRAVAGMRRTG